MTTLSRYKCKSCGDGRVPLRKRAFTAAWEGGIDPRKAAIAIGCNVDTMIKHYVSMDEQAVTDEVMKQLGGRLAAG